MTPSLLQIVLSIVGLCLEPLLDRLDRIEDWIRGTYR